MTNENKNKVLPKFGPIFKNIMVLEDYIHSEPLDMSIKSMLRNWETFVFYEVERINDGTDSKPDYSKFFFRFNIICLDKYDHTLGVVDSIDIKADLNFLFP